MNDFGSVQGGGNKRRKKKKKASETTRMAIVIGIAILLVIAVGVLLYFLVIKPSQREETLPSIDFTESAPPETAPTETEPQEILPEEIEAVLAAAKIKAAMYDYDAAIEYVKTEIPDFLEYQELLDAITLWKEEKSELIKWPDNTQITHVFFHILVADEQTAFANSNYEKDDYNMVMTTVDEFNEIIQLMYDKGYVMVHLSDIAEIQTQADGTEKMVFKDIWLPEGKIPFVLSQDDVCYYEYMLDAGEWMKASDRGETYDGYATKLVYDADGKLTSEMKMADGTYTYGAYDMVPLIDAFVEKHPDFSYRGAKGTLALTGYNGIFGYRTSYISYGSDEVLQQHYNELFKSPMFDEKEAYRLARIPETHLYNNDNIEADREMAAKIAATLKETGWKLASHTWGHMNMANHDNVNPAERFYRDTQWWDVEVRDLIGGTDIIIFAFGGDLGSWRPYNSDNKLYTWLKADGFNYYCNVDASSAYWVQRVGSVKSEDGSYADSGYFRQARRNLDGQRMFESIVYMTVAPNEGDEGYKRYRLRDLFDPREIYSLNRPWPSADTEVFLGIKLPEGFNADAVRRVMEELQSGKEEGK